MQGLTHLLHLLLVCNSIVTFSIRVRFACHGINVQLGVLKYKYSSTWCFEVWIQLWSLMFIYFCNVDQWVSSLSHSVSKFVGLRSILFQQQQVVELFLLFPVVGVYAEQTIIRNSTQDDWFAAWSEMHTAILKHYDSYHHNYLVLPHSSRRKCLTCFDWQVIWAIKACLSNCNCTLKMITI